MVWSWPDDIYDALVAVANNPTPEEIEDLSLIDRFFYGPVPTKFTTQRQRQAAPFGMEVCVLSPKQMRAGAGYPLFNAFLYNRDVLIPFKDRPFFCPPSFQMPQPVTFFVWKDQLARYFGISPRREWGEAELAVRNTVAFLQALVDYPFPRPIGAMPGVWYHMLRSDIQKYVNDDMIETVPLSRMWITIATVETYPDVSAKIIRELKEKAKRQKRKALLKKIALGLTFAVIGAGVGAALVEIIPAGVPIAAGDIASATTQAIQTGIDKEDRKKVAESLEKTAKLFEQDDPRFAEELRKTAETFDYLGSQAERAKDLSEEEAEAVVEGETEREIGADTHGMNLDFYPEDSPLTGLLIGGGVAAAAAGLFAVLG